jgi:hypothetical protein
MYDPYFLLHSFLKEKQIDINNIDDKELPVLFGLASYCADVFY